MGAIVRSVEPDGPAAKGGIEAGDIIVKVDGRRIERSGDLPRIVGGTAPGTKSTVQVFRRGKLRELTVTVGEFPADNQVAQAGREPPTSAAPTASALGLVVADLTEAQKKELGVRGGVQVQSADGPAARARLQAGDVILQIGNAEVNDSQQFRDLAARAAKDRDTVSVLVRRGDWVNFFLIKPER